MHKTVYDWRAKRAGGRMTVYGKLADGTETKIVGVDQISLDPGGDCRDAVFATDLHGEVHILKIGPRP